MIANDSYDSLFQACIDSEFSSLSSIPIQPVLADIQTNINELKNIKNPKTRKYQQVALF